jgi:hypothetical protein
MESNFQLLPMHDLAGTKYEEVSIGFTIEDGNLSASGNITIKEAEQIKKQLEEEIKSSKIVRKGRKKN